MEASHCHYSNKKKLLVYQNVITSYIVSQGDLVTINLILHWHLYFIFLMKMCMYSALWLLIYLFKQNHAIKFVVVLYIFYLKTKKNTTKLTDHSFIKKKSIGRFDFITEYIVSIVLFIYWQYLFDLFSLGIALYMIPHLLGPFQNYVFTDKLKARIDKLIYMGIDMQ